MNLEKEIMDKSFKAISKDPIGDEWLVLDVTTALKIAREYGKQARIDENKRWLDFFTPTKFDKYMEDDLVPFENRIKELTK